VTRNSSIILSGYLNGKPGSAAQKKFQIIEFAQSGNHYRMELQNPNNPSQWVYFSHPDILKEIDSILK
jgi:hypothetical protein